MSSVRIIPSSGRIIMDGLGFVSVQKSSYVFFFFFFKTPTQYFVDGPLRVQPNDFPLSCASWPHMLWARLFCIFLGFIGTCLVSDMAICIHIRSSHLLDLAVKFYLFAVLFNNVVGQKH